MAERSGHGPENDASDLAQVAALVARAGLRLPADEIAELVSAYRSDRAALERLRALIAADDEPAPAFRAGPTAQTGAAS